jgi:hypothetical protein
MAQFKSKHAVLTLRSVSMQCMQCNAIQCNARNTMQCNAIQCNVCTEVRPSVRNEVSQSFFIFFIFLVSIRKSVSMYGTRMSWMDRRFSYFLVSMYMSRTDKFQLFQFSFSSVALSSKSVRPYGKPTKKKKKKYVTTKTET